MVLLTRNLRKAFKTNTESKSLPPIPHMKTNMNPKNQPRLSNLPNQAQTIIIPPSIHTILLQCLTTPTLPQILTLILSSLQVQSAILLPRATNHLHKWYKSNHPLSTAVLKAHTSTFLLSLPTLSQ